MVKFSQKRFGKSKRDKIIKEGKEHIGKWRSFYDKNIQYFKESIKFVNGEQWEQDAKAQYTNAAKVMLTFNKIRPYIRQILGEDRSFSVDIKLKSVGQNTEDTPQQKETQQKKDVLSGLVRNIAYHSRSMRIYNEGYQDALEGGFGAWRVYVSKEGVHNDLRIEDIRNPLSAYWDPNAKTPCKLDGEYAGVVTYISKKEWDRRYPNIPYPETSEFTPTSEYNVEWGTEDRIAICEEYRREKYSVKVFIGEDGTEYSDKDMEEQPELEQQITRTKKVTKSRIIHYKFTDHHLLDQSETPFSDIPIIFIGGYIRLIDGKETIYSYHDDARDAQRELNFIGSDIAEWLKITKKTKFLVPARQIERYLDDWNYPDKASHLTYDPDGAPGYKPETINPPAMPTDLVAQYQRAEQDIRIALGRYEPNTGAPSNETSGVAILNRGIQGNSTIEIFRENRNFAIAETGRVILNAIPKVHDDTRYVTITDKDGEDKDIGINQPRFDAEKGQYVHEKSFEENSYSIEVAVGNSFPMQKAENAQLALDLIKADPSGQSYALLAHFIAESLDTSKAAEMSSYLKTLIPPAAKMQVENPQGAEQEKMQAAQQQAKQQQIQEKMQGLALQNAQAEVTTKMHKMMDDHTKAMASHTDSIANMIKAMVAKYEAAHKQGIENVRATAEIEKSQNEALKSKYELGKQVIQDKDG